MSTNNLKINETSNDTLYHNAIDNIEDETSNYDSYNRSDMDNFFHSFIKHNNSNDGNLFFDSLIAGDYRTSTKPSVSSAPSSPYIPPMKISTYSRD